MKLETYEIIFGDGHWVKVRGLVNPKGWLEYKMRDGTQGIKRPGTFRATVVRTQINPKEAA